MRKLGQVLKKTAFILQIHKNPNQVNQFIQQLIQNDLADVYIHIDKKSNIKDEIIKDSHVHILEEQLNCEWGDISQVDCTLLLFKEVIKSGIDYDYVVLKSGQDLLVRDGLKDLFLEADDQIYIKIKEETRRSLNMGLMMINWPKIARKRYTNRHPVRMIRRLLLLLYRRGIHLFKNKNYWPEHYHFYNGSQWFSLPLDVVKYILDFLDENKWYYQFFKNTLCPDEWFFQTLLMNSPYKSKVINENFVYLKWGVELEKRNSPELLSEMDIKDIGASKKFFARKFDEKYNQAVIDYYVKRYSFQSKKLLYRNSQEEAPQVL